MRRPTVLAIAGLLLLACVLPAIASAEEEEATFPYGRWEGSVIGEGLDKEGKEKKPIAVKVWLSDNGDGTVGMSVSTPAVPFAFSAEPSTPRKVNGGWDVPVTVAYGKGKRSIKGTGTVQLRQRADGWYAWGSGTGSALGSKQGSGHGSATRVTQESTSRVEQILSPLKDTIESFTKDEAVPVPTVYPEAEFATPPETPAEAPVVPVAAPGEDVDQATPNEIGAFLILLLVLLVYGITGLLLFLGVGPTAEPGLGAGA